jgi:hypothetical protein
MNRYQKSGPLDEWFDQIWTVGMLQGSRVVCEGLYWIESRDFWVVYETSINSPNVVWNITLFHFLRELEVFSGVSQRRNISSLSTFYFKSKPSIVTGNIPMTSSLCFCVCNFFSFCSFLETIGMHALKAKVFLTQWLPSLVTMVSTVHQKDFENIWCLFSTSV